MTKRACTPSSTSAATPFASVTATCSPLPTRTPAVPRSDAPRMPSPLRSSHTCTAPHALAQQLGGVAARRTVTNARGDALIQTLQWFKGSIRKAACPLQMAGRATRVRQHKDGIAIAVRAHGNHIEDVAGGFALHPQ